MSYGRRAWEAYSLFYLSLEWSDSLCDVAWSETHDAQMVTSSGDGSIQLWDLGVPVKGPLRLYKEHSQEVASVDFYQLDGGNLFLR